jgi:RNA polymerase sigma-70 factor, ECF subfamily
MPNFVTKLLHLPVVLSLRNLSDEELMKKIISGEKLAFDVLYDRYIDQVWSFILYKVNNQERAIELTQDIMLKIYKQASSYNQNSKFCPWLWTIVRHHLIDDYKSRDALGPSMQRDFNDNHQNPEEDANPIEEKFSYDDAKDEPFISLINKVNNEAIQDCFKRLPDMQKEILSLKLFTDLSLEEISSQCNKKVGAIKSIIFRAKESLVACLEQKGLS